MLRSITLHGFKSFADRTRLEFGPGVSAVIGPNGSGKSNVVEAIRWVTHGARARELRAARPTELIFHGSGGKAPLGLAEVQLELQTPGGRVNLARRLYRDGSAEQDLGGAPARVRDVQGALRGTGLGPGGLAVIGQGEVSGVVGAEGRTLLGYVQEAAGLSRAVGVRLETETRLREADGHLAGVRALLAERQGVADRLGEAAAAARRAGELDARVRTLEDALRRERQVGLAAEIAGARREAAALDTRSADLSGRVGAAASAVEGAREAALEARARREQHHGALDALRAAREAHAQAARYAAHLGAEAQRLTAEAAALPHEAPEEARPDLVALETEVRQARTSAEEAERRARRLESELNAARGAAARAAERAAHAEGGLHVMQAELAQAEATLAAAGTERGGAAATLEGARLAREAAEARYAALGASRAAVASRERALGTELTRIRAALGPLRRERERLEGALNAYARYGEGARNALRQEHPGIVGSVADLLTVPAEYETAVTAALGRRLEQVVVGSADDAREIIAELKRVGGRATFLPLDLIRARPRRDGALGRDPGVVGNLADLCPSDPPVVAEVVLGDTLLVRDLAAANRIARAHASRARLVTLDGEVLESGGAITGGRLRDAGSSVLADQRRFHELDEEIGTLEGQLTSLEQASAALQAEVQGAAAGHDALLAEREAAARAERDAERRLSGLDAALRGAEEARARLLARLVPAPSEPEGAPLPDLAALEAAWQEARGAGETGRAAERAAAEALALARDLDARWRAFETARTRREAIAARLAEGALAAQAQAAHLDAAAAEVRRREAALGEHDEHEFARAEAAREAAALAYANLIGEQNRLRARLDELRLLVARREGSLDELAPGCLPPGTPREWSAELTRARAGLEALGPVNARAEADHAAALADLAAQSAEVADADSAAAELRGHLAGLLALETQATREAFDRVAAAFADYSAELLGGEGALESETDETGRLTGLRLAVQPRGKRTRALGLLSAGERTMAGLGFLFALNHAGGEGGAGGLPLAVLDEVDAPLDEANIRRFTAFLDLFSQRGAQFLLVTHQKATMEVAQALWGVTTDATGASRVLSIRQPEEARVPVPG